MAYQPPIYIPSESDGYCNYLVMKDADSYNNEPKKGIYKETKFINANCLQILSQAQTMNHLARFAAIIAGIGGAILLVGIFVSAASPFASALIGVGTSLSFSGMIIGPTCLIARHEHLEERGLETDTFDRFKEWGLTFIGSPLFLTAYAIAGMGYLCGKKEWINGDGLTQSTLQDYWIGKGPRMRQYQEDPTKENPNFVYLETPHKS